MPTIDTSTLTTINKDTNGTWQGRTCTGIIQPVEYNITAGEACKSPSGGIYQDDNGFGDCFECVGFSRTEVRTLKQGSTTVYVKVFVTFDEEGGSSVSNKYVYYGSGRTYGTLPTTSRSGYTFQGWWTGDNGTGTQITSSTVVTTTSTSQTLYAKWQQNAAPTVAPSVTQLQCFNNQLYADVYWGGFNYPRATVEVSRFSNFPRFDTVTVTISSGQTVNVGPLGNISSGTYTVFARATDAGGTRSSTASRTQNVGCFSQFP